MKRCRQPIKEEDGEVFVVLWPEPHYVTQGIPVGIVCEDCGGTFWTTLENRSTALTREMKVLCLQCARKKALEEKREMIVGGTVSGGEIVKIPKD